MKEQAIEYIRTGLSDIQKRIGKEFSARYKFSDVSECLFVQILPKGFPFKSEFAIEFEDLLIEFEDQFNLELAFIDQSSLIDMSDSTNLIKEDGSEVVVVKRFSLEYLEAFNQRLNRLAQASVRINQRIIEAYNFEKVPSIRFYNENHSYDYISVDIPSISKSRILGNKVKIEAEPLPQTEKLAA